MRKHWLLFTQVVTIALALLFIIQTLKPDLLPRNARNWVVTLQESPTPTNATPPPAASLRDAAHKAMPAVVNIYTTSTVKNAANPFLDDPRFRFFFGDQLDEVPRNNSSLGSGVIASPDGYILTNHHVVETAAEIEVALADGRKTKAQIVGSDPETDLAVIKVALPEDLPSITFGHPEQSQVGDMVLAIGNPFGVGQTVTMGIVSALKRDHLGINTFENFIQTDAAINPGNSGGALVDTDGNLLGINSAIYSPSGGSLGIGFAIPANTAKKTMEQIILQGSVTRGWIGAGVQEITEELAASFGLDNINGVLITEIIPGSPAEQAGMLAGDVLTAINGTAIDDWHVMLETVANLPPGQTVSAQVIRDRTKKQLRIHIGRRPTPKNNAANR